MDFLYGKWLTQRWSGTGHLRRGRGLKDQERVITPFVSAANCNRSTATLSGGVVWIPSVQAIPSPGHPREPVSLISVYDAQGRFAIGFDSAS